MEEKSKFKVVYSEEAIQFLNTLDVKVKNKIAYNIDKSMHVIDKELFKKLDDTDVWEFRTVFNGIHIGYWLFGIKTMKLWS